MQRLGLHRQIDGAHQLPTTAALFNGQVQQAGAAIAAVELRMQARRLARWAGWTWRSQLDGDEARSRLIDHRGQTRR